MVLNSVKRSGNSRRSIWPLVWLILLLVIVGGIVLTAKLFELEAPQISLAANVHLLGKKGDITLTFADAKSGIRDLDVSLRQGKNVVRLLRRQFSRASLLAKGPLKISEKVDINTADLGLVDGRADLIVTAHDFSAWHWGKGNETLASYPLIFDIKPPKLRLVDGPGSIKPGSSAIIIYRANEELVRYGVTINGYFYPGFPVTARGEGTYGAMIALPYDTKTIKEAVISGYDLAGNAARVPFRLVVRLVPKRQDRINISDKFLQWKMPQFVQYYPEMKAFNGDLLKEFLFVNNEVRTRNAKKIRAICLHSSPERMWRGRFGRMRRSARRASYADYRSYYYHGRVVDHQVHLGVDLASIRHARVEAANNGRVIYADYLGIYGNVVILDHGQGVSSLYAHLSQFKVAVGDVVKKGDLLAITGTTGMAGGDHLHFSILVNGVFVNPLEWWDSGWLHFNIEQYLK
ncbi:MAG: M23 family metallopeptidase [Deltaproteobacteria bacterium]|nr:M23 family metallopeptidase [Deltaproteobacteria bacterium]